MVYFINRGGGMANEGPISEGDVRAQIASGRLGMNALIWAQGMPEWITVGAWMNQSGIPMPSNDSPMNNLRPVGPGYGLPVPADKKGTGCITMAQVGLALTILSTAGLMIAGVIICVMESAMNEYGALSEETALPPEFYGVFGFAVVCLLALLISFLIYILGWIWCLIRVWRVLQMVQPHIGEELPTPGWAAGGLFIPFYNFYWIFVAYGAIPKFVRRLPGNPPAINENNIMLMNVGILGGIVFQPLVLMQLVCCFLFLSQLKKFLKWADGQ